MTKEQENAAYYAVVPAPVRYDAELSPSAKLLYCEITSLCRSKGCCWATNSYFTQLFDLSESTISRLISQLAKRKHIVIQTVATETGSERRIYTDIFQVERLSAGAPEGGAQKPQAPQGDTQKPQEGGAQKQQGGVRKNRKQNDYQLNDCKDNPPYSPPRQPQAAGTVVPRSGMTSPTGDGAPVEAEEGAPIEAQQPAPTGDKPAPKPRRGRRNKSAPDHNPEAFEIFWAAYPRKDNRKKAIDAWDRLGPDRELCRTMYVALKRQCRDPQWAEEDGKYIPMFSTWLNQRRWENQGVDLSLVQAAQPQGGGTGWADDGEG